MMKRLRYSVTAGLCLACVTAVTAAQPYPSKPITMIVSLPAGTASDLLARIVGQGLSKFYGQQVSTLNLPGAGGLIGGMALVKAKNDGYTIGIISPPHIIGPLVQAVAPYHPLKDMVPVIHVASVPNVIVVGLGTHINSMRELIASVKADSSKFNFASFGVGTTGHIAAELLNVTGGIKPVQVPFKSLGPIMGAMVQGQVLYFVPATITALGLISGSNGRLRALAVTSNRRSLAFPDVPTVAEAGYPDAQFDSWYGVAVPAGTARAIVERLNMDIAKVLQMPDV